MLLIRGETQAGFCLVRTRGSQYGKASFSHSSSTTSGFPLDRWPSWVRTGSRDAYSACRVQSRSSAEGSGCWVAKSRGAPGTWSSSQGVSSAAWEWRNAYSRLAGQGSRCKSLNHDGLLQAYGEPMVLQRKNLAQHRARAREVKRSVCACHIETPQLRVRTQSMLQSDPQVSPPSGVPSSSERRRACVRSGSPPSAWSTQAHSEPEIIARWLRGSEIPETPLIFFCASGGFRWRAV